MKSRDVAVVCAVAGVTAVVLVAVLVPAMAEAEGPKGKVSWVALTPELKLDGAALTLTTEKKSYRAGEKPVVLVEAKSYTDESVTVDATVRMMCKAPSSPMSRMLVMPRKAWERKCRISLDGRGTSTVSIPSDVGLAAGQEASFTVTVDGKRAIAWRPGVLAPEGSLWLKIHRAAAAQTRRR